MTGTRRGGGKHLEADCRCWQCDDADPDVIAWTGVDWDARAATAKTAGQVDDTVLAILQVVADHEWLLTESKVLAEVGGKREKAREAFKGLRVNGVVEVKNCAADENGRPVNRDRVGLGPQAERQRTYDGQPVPHTTRA